MSCIIQSKFNIHYDLYKTKDHAVKVIHTLVPSFGKGKELVML